MSLLPVADTFNFVVCGFATLAATVGYAYARKTRPLPSRGAAQYSPPDHNSISNSTPGTSSRTIVLEKPVHGEQAEAPPVSSSIIAEKPMDEDPNGVKPMDEGEDSHIEKVEVKVTPTPLGCIVPPNPMFMDEDLDGVPIAASQLVSEPEPTTVISEDTTMPALSKHNSLKRKRTHEQEEALVVDPDMGYPHNLSSIYPNKRRSDSVSDEEATTDAKEIVAEPSDSANNQQPHPTIISDPVSSELKSDGIEGRPSLDVLKQDEPALPEGPKPAVVESPSTLEPLKLVTEVPRFAFQTAFPRTPPRVTHFPSARTTTASPGFANFGGSSSPFFHSTALAGKPVWASPSAGEEASAGACSDEQKPLAPATTKTAALAVQPHSTGEEDEDIALDLKGVKLYIKRGEDNFSGGMIGHIKLLAHKTTAAKRLLFRREPLWKVSMNIRMQPTVRCTFDPQENILRVALKELPAEKSSPASEGPQTIIYAFKPSRSCRRSDFHEFAEALLAQAREGGQS
ncbi:hypothetical protein K438DRAFT_1967835 [Mycena galopus ATCC 62051]|nr:hypothetical protein K438DRAFT_1967835 [Mycena galopus ATCC 62051]